MIEAQNLVKWYGPTRAVDGISFRIEPGQIVGFLGPNGAGKSTTIRMLTGYLPPTSGVARIDGHDVAADADRARRSIGYLPESTPLYPEMRVEEYLHYRGQLMRMRRADRKRRIGELCDRCGLTQIRRRLIGQLSKGNRQRVGLAQALMHEPPVLILDEPTAGLDPNQIGQVRRLIEELKGRHTVLLSTHILPEVEKTADRVIIVAGGRIAAEGSPEELRQRIGHGARLIVEAKAPAAEVVAALKGAPGVADAAAEAQGEWTRATVTPAAGADAREAVARVLMGRGWPLRELRREAASLEEFFVRITAQQNVAAPNVAA